MAFGGMFCVLKFIMQAFQAEPQTCLHSGRDPVCLKVSSVSPSTTFRAMAQVILARVALSPTSHLSVSAAELITASRRHKAWMIRLKLIIAVFYIEYFAT